MEQQIIALCAWKGPAGIECNKPATHQYLWEWGEEGKVCAACTALVNQAATNLSRNVSVKLLDNSAPSPLARSERTMLIAAKLSAEGELEEVQRRGHALYESNVELTQQVQSHTLRAREHASIVEHKETTIMQLEEKLEKRERELAAATSEVQRLTVLAQFAPTETSRVLDRD